MGNIPTIIVCVICRRLKLQNIRLRNLQARPAGVETRVFYLIRSRVTRSTYTFYNILKIEHMDRTRSSH